MYVVHLSIILWTLKLGCIYQLLSCSTAGRLSSPHILEYIVTPQICEGYSVKLLLVRRNNKRERELSRHGIKSRNDDLRKLLPAKGAYHDAVMPTK